MFIAIEGIDGSGKGTHAKLLNKWLKDKGYDTFLTSEPTNGVVGRVLRRALKDGVLDSKTEALLFAADRSEHVKEIIPKLEGGKVVVSERYIYSSIAYQGASGVSIDWIKEVNRFAPMPDCTIFLDISPEIGLKRIGSKGSLRSSVRGQEYFEKRDFLTKVRDIYIDLDKKDGRMYRIDAGGGIDEVQTSIRRKVGRVLKDFERKKKTSSKKTLDEFII